MKPGRHAVASFFAGTTIWVLTNNKPAGAVCFLAGMLPDVDHILEFVIHRGIKNCSLSRVYRAFDRNPEDHAPIPFPRLYLFLHSGEAAILLWLAAVYYNNLYLLAAATGYSLHLVMDSRGNKDVPAVFYWFIWRMRYGFDCAVMTGLAKRGRGQRQTTADGSAARKEGV